MQNSDLLVTKNCYITLAETESLAILIAWAEFTNAVRWNHCRDRSIPLNEKYPPFFNQIERANWPVETR